MRDAAAGGAELEVGSVVAERYVVEQLVGRGGMGAVYAALDRKLGRRVALKIVAATASPGARRRLEAEARTVASLEHPGIVALYDIVEERDKLVVVMELVQGASLRQKLTRGPQPRRDVAGWIQGVALALEAAHGRGLVHRDVKPDNILVRDDGRTALLDFGIAKAISHDSSDDALAPTMTSDGAVAGTPAYLAPEQARGEELGPATDQFALAVTAYELLSGALPWPTGSFPALVAAIVSGPYRPLGGAAAGASTRVDAVLERALSKDAALRYPSVTAFARALDDALAVGAGHLDKATTSPPASAPAAPPPRAPRRFARVTLAVFGAATILGWAGTRLWRSRAPSAEASAQPPKSVVGPAAPGGPVRWTDLAPSGAVDDVERGKFAETTRAIEHAERRQAREAIDPIVASRPEFAAAQLLRAYLSFMKAMGLDEPARVAMREAAAHRDVLGPRDQQFLDALTPSFLDPPRFRDTAELLEAMVRDRPTDAPAWEALGVARTKLGDYPAGEAAFERESAVDPHAVFSYVVRSKIRYTAGDADASRRILDACIRAEPLIASCRAELALALSSSGECDAADAVARDALAVDPHNGIALEARASAAAVRGAPDALLLKFLEQRYATIDNEFRGWKQARDAVALAQRAGDFAGGLSRLHDAMRVGGLTSNQVTAAALQRVELEWEAGDEAAAAATAEETLADEATLRLPERAFADPTGVMLGVLRAAKRISPAEHARRRDAWVTSWRARRDATEWTHEVGPYVWSAAYGTPDLPTPAEARAALAAFDALGLERPKTKAELWGIPTPVRMALGEDLAATGELERGELALGLRECDITPNYRGDLALAAAYVQGGDVAGACGLYEGIVKAWGHAKPRSVTADAARKAMAPLRCRR